jgi:WD40 repeat protein/tRNA A-37 threonylcarbamoyl transferase component Bud32
MIYCLNPVCQQPQNSDDAEYCLSCGAKLTPLLRGRYRVVRPIGQGGFGKTFLAVDEDRLNSRCVIKQFSPQLEGAKSLEKAIRLFGEEAVRLHELGEHPQIPTLLAYFEHEQHLYLVQQFVEGLTLLQELQQQGMFGEAKIRAILAGILPILKYVHDHQVIHRDITPSNIIRRKLDNKLVLIDFGVAKLLSAATSALPGTKIGTEGYAPIEQLRSGKAYPASDLYSLAATCVFLMTQTKPEELYDPLEGRWLWRERLRDRGGTVSEPIAQILDKMLKDLVSERYASADAVMRDLRLALSRPAAATVSSLGNAGGGAIAASRPPTSISSPSPSHPTSQPKGSASAPRVSSLLSRPPVSGVPNRHCLHTLMGHSSWVMAVAVSADGQLIASGGLDNTVTLWNLRTGELLRILTGHTKAVNCLTFTPDSQAIVSGSDDDSIRIWQVSTGKLLRVLTGHSRDVNSVTVHAGSNLLASGSEDRTIRIWNLATGELVRGLAGIAGMIRSVAISPSGYLLASGGLDHQIKLWSLQTGEQTRTFVKGHFNSVNSVVFHPNGRRLFSGSKDKTIKVWDLAKGEAMRTLTGHTDSVNAIALSADGKRLVSGSSDKTVRLWNSETGALTNTFSDHVNAVNAIAISPDGRVAVSGSSDHAVKVWQL